MEHHNEWTSQDKQLDLKTML